MTGTSSHIVHKGVVINSIGDKAIVYLTKAEGCHTCHLKSVCGEEDEDRFRFEVPLGDLRIGDEVSLELRSSVGFRALFWAYLVPFLLVMLVLVGGTFLRMAEHWLGVLALLMLPPYFLGLSRFRKKLKTHLDLRVIKL